ncbi:hypothetical protein GWK26_04960 [haloarchaeon 3A1-DGR]|nr:hypothetical protein GWK26_04960 [haloarchaeon 3A1-DGR]
MTTGKAEGRVRKNGENGGETRRTVAKDEGNGGKERGERRDPVGPLERTSANPRNYIKTLSRRCSLISEIHGEDTQYDLRVRSSYEVD